MPRVGRNRSKHLRMPVGWEPKASGIYFRPTNAADVKIVVAITGGPKSLLLGATVDEAHRGDSWKRILAARVKETEVVEGEVSEILDRARRDYLPKIKNPETRAWRARHVDELDREFGKLRYARNVYDATKAKPGTHLVAMNVQAFLDRNAETRPAAANRCVQTGRIVWAEARRRWGLTEYNPFEGLQNNEELPREAMPDDRTLFRVMRRMSPPGRFILALGRYYGRRPGEARAIDVTGVDAEGVHTVRLKNKKRTRELILEWDDVQIGEAPDGSAIMRPGRLRKMVARALRWRAKVIRPEKVWKNGRRPKAPAVVSTKLLINRRGRAVSKTGYQSEFRDVMAALGLVEDLGTAFVGGREVRRTRRAFNVNDTRAKRATTLPKGHATEVLAHDEQRTTEEHYRRGPIRIRVRDER